MLRTTRNIGLVLGMAPFVSAGFCTKAKRIQVSDDINVSGRWNDVDANKTAEALFKDVTESEWYVDFIKAHPGRKPIVTFGKILIRAHEHIDPNGFLLAIRSSLIKGRRIRVVENQKALAITRDERAAQREHAASKHHKADKQEIAADFILKGTLISTVDGVASRRVAHYRTSLELCDVRTGEVVWAGDHEEKKLWKKRWVPT